MKTYDQRLVGTQRRISYQLSAARSVGTAAAWNVTAGDGATQLS